MLLHSFSACEFKVTMAPADEPWNTVVVERFNSSTAERDAHSLAASLQGLAGAIVQVSCAQCW